MPTRWNVGHSPVVYSWTERAVMPGDPHEFTEEEIAAGLAGDWSDSDPRAGLAAEKAFKKRRDAAAKKRRDAKQDADAQSVETHPDPAESGDKE